MINKKKIAVIHTTHWDREWFFSQEHAKTLFLFHFKDVLENLENGKLKTYLLDGQVSILDEYLSVYPEDRKLVEKFVNEKRLTVGPWWSQSDQVIVKGGSLINNARIGIKFAKSLGATDFLGYVPDSFGQIADMPKILKGFGIKDYIFWRGNTPKKSAHRNFTWKANDGSSLNAHNIKEGYGSGSLLLVGSKDQVQDLYDRASRFTTIDPLISVGGDQRALDRNFEQRLEEINKLMPEYELYGTTYQEFFKNVFKAEGTYEGEMVDGLDSKIHRSIYSSRSDIKILSSAVESSILNELVPMVYIAKQNFDIDFVEAIETQIKKLAASQAHDSMGNCNIDSTNDDIINRLQSVKNSTEALISLLKRKISEAINKPLAVTVFNVHSQLVNRPIAFKISTKQNKLSLVVDGKDVTFQTITTTKLNKGTIKRTEKELDPANDYYEHDVVVTGLELEPYSYKTIEVKEQDSKVKQNKLENKFKISVDAKNGINISNALSKPVLVSLVSVTDDGDSYDFSHLKDDKIIDFAYKLENTTDSELFCEYIVNATYSRQFAINVAKMVNHSVVIKLIVNKFDNTITTKVATTNLSYDHRLTLKVTHNLDTKTSVADQGLSTITRKNFQDEMTIWKQDQWKEEPTNIYGVLSWAKQSNGKEDLTVFLKGGKEYIPTDNAIELTIFRSYQWLGKPLLERRPGIASGQEFKWTPTTNAGLLNKEIEQTFKLSFDKLTIKETKNIARLFETKLPYHQNQELNSFTDTMRFFPLQKLEKQLPMDFKVFKEFALANEVNLENIYYHTKDEIIITLVNNSNSSIDNRSRIIFNNSACGVYDTDLLGNKNKLVNDSGILEISSFTPNEIKHFLIKG